MNSEEVLDLLGDYPGESRKSRRALLDYAMMPGRSLKKLWRVYQEQDKPPTKRLKTLDKWSSVFDWQHRVSLLDAAEEKERADKWIKRREELNEKDWRHGNDLRAKAIQNLIEVVKIPTLYEVANTLQIASKLQRLAAGTSTENVNIYGQSLIAAIEHELARLGYGEATGGLSLPEESTDSQEDTAI